MSFQPYYSTPLSGYIINALLWVGIMTVICVIAVGVVMLLDREFQRRVLLGGIIAGVIIGGLGGVMCAGIGDQDVNVSILQANIEKKYDVQSETFDFTTTKGGGHGWTPTQSDPQQVIVKVNNVSHVTTLTQNPQTNEPTLIDADTKKDIALRADASQ
jgi:apolipoprotein N-acyltransferase